MKESHALNFPSLIVTVCSLVGSEEEMKYKEQGSEWRVAFSASHLVVFVFACVSICDQE